MKNNFFYFVQKAYSRFEHIQQISYKRYHALLRVVQVN